MPGRAEVLGWQAAKAGRKAFIKEPWSTMVQNEDTDAAGSWLGTNPWCSSKLMARKRPRRPLRENVRGPVGGKTPWLVSVAV